MCASRPSAADRNVAVRPCNDADFAETLTIINDAAEAYRGQIPADCWHEPYMPAGHLRDELKKGVQFSGATMADASTGVPRLIGVMGSQFVQDVMLIRHAYVATSAQRRGIGSLLLRALCAQTDRPVLIGTWAAARWAIDFYLRHDFSVITGEQKDALLERYWTVPERQRATSVVLADRRWRETNDSRTT